MPNLLIAGARLGCKAVSLRRRAHFNLGKAVGKRIKGEILAGENVILDTKFLDPNDAADLRSAIETNGWQRKILWSKDK